MSHLTILDTQEQELFPSTSRALTYPNGLLAVGGDLRPKRLIAAYRLGIFPWPTDDRTLLWWAPDPRMILRPGTMHISRSLKKYLAKQDYSVSYNQQFTSVINHCARNRYRKESWITQQMIHSYQKMHSLGYAHSVEISQEGELTGGLYGLAIGAVFFGESMFSLRPDAAKLALYHLSTRLKQKGFLLIDCQIRSPFLISLGAKDMPRSTFEHQLSKLIDLDREF